MLVGIVTSFRGGKIDSNKLSDLPKVPLQVAFPIFCAAFYTGQVLNGLDLRECVSSDVRLMDHTLFQFKFFIRDHETFPYMTLCPCVSQNFVFHKSLIDGNVYGLSGNLHFLD